MDNIVAKNFVLQTKYYSRGGGIGGERLRSEKEDGGRGTERGRKREREGQGEGERERGTGRRREREGEGGIS